MIGRHPNAAHAALGQEAELPDNGSSYVSGELAVWLGDKKMAHVRSAPYHRQTQGKIKRWHQNPEKTQKPPQHGY
jgi:transposase InsO family protein